MYPTVSRFVVPSLALIGLVLVTPAQAVDQYVVSPTTYTWIEVDETNADVSDNDDDYAVSLDLPWVFPFGDPGNERDIVSAAMSSNGGIILREVDEIDSISTYSAADCSLDPPDDFITDYPDLDQIFANHDDLTTYWWGNYGIRAFAAGELDAAGIKVAEDVVVFYWNTETYYDDDYDLLNRFEVLLYPDGRIVWNFESFQWTGYDGDPYSGIVAAEPVHKGVPRYTSVGCATGLGFGADDVTTAGGLLLLEEAYQAAHNQAPTADAQQLTTGEGVPLPITLTGSDPEGQPLTFTVTVDPANGSLSGTPPDVEYAPAPDFTGTDTFEFTADDGGLTSAAAEISIEVEPAGDDDTGDDDTADDDTGDDDTVTDDDDTADDDDDTGARDCTCRLDRRGIGAVSVPAAMLLLLVSRRQRHLR